MPGGVRAARPQPNRKSHAAGEGTAPTLRFLLRRSDPRVGCRLLCSALPGAARSVGCGGCAASAGGSWLPPLFRQRAWLPARQPTGHGERGRRSCAPEEKAPARLALFPAAAASRSPGQPRAALSQPVRDAAPSPSAHRFCGSEQPGRGGGAGGWRRRSRPRSSACPPAAAAEGLSRTRRRQCCSRTGRCCAPRMACRRGSCRAGSGARPGPSAALAAPAAGRSAPAAPHPTTPQAAGLARPGPLASSGHAAHDTRPPARMPPRSGQGPPAPGLEGGRRRRGPSRRSAGNERPPLGCTRGNLEDRMRHPASSRTAAIRRGRAAVERRGRFHFESLSIAQHPATHKPHLPRTDALSWRVIDFIVVPHTHPGSNVFVKTRTLTGLLIFCSLLPKPVPKPVARILPKEASTSWGISHY